MFGLGGYVYAVRRTVWRMLAKFVRGRLDLGETLLIVAPHPDDETFGTGALVAATRLRRVPPAVHIVFLTSGSASHRGCCQIDEETLSSAREATARRVSTSLGVALENLHFLRLTDGALPHDGDVLFEPVCRRLADLIARIAPRQVFTTNPFEVWPDHLAADQLTRHALRQSGVHAELYHYCVWFWIKMPLRSLLRVDWTNAIMLNEARAGASKANAIRMYLTDLAPCGQPYCGRLVTDFLRSFTDTSELFFRVPSERW